MILGQNGHFLARLAKIGQNEKFYQKSGRAIFFTLIVPQLHAEFQKNCWSGFRDQIVTDGRTDARTDYHTYKVEIIEPVAFAGSNICILCLDLYCSLYDTSFLQRAL